MFSETLKLIPRLSEADAKKVEATLGQRFMKVARNFGTALKGVVKGTVIGISLALLAKLLNPLQELEDRIKKLLGEADDARDLADKYGATTGQVLKLQALGNTIGLKPEQLESMMESFRKAVDEERKLIDEGKFTEAESAMSYVHDDNTLEAFVTFIKSIKTLGQGSPIGRTNVERQVFGDKLSGPQRRLIDSDFGDVAGALPSAADFEKAAANAIVQSNRYRMGTTLQDSWNFIRSSGAIDGNTISGMLSGDRRTMNKDFKELTDYQTLLNAAKAINVFIDLMTLAKDQIIALLSVAGSNIGTIARIIEKLSPYNPGKNSEGKK